MNYLVLLCNIGKFFANLEKYLFFLLMCPLQVVVGRFLLIGVFFAIILFIFPTVFHLW